MTLRINLIVFFSIFGQNTLRMINCANKAAHKDVRFMTEAGTLLSASLDFQETLNSIIKLAVPHFGDFCFLDILEPDGIYRTRASSLKSSDTEITQTVTPKAITQEVVRLKAPFLTSDFSKFANTDDLALRSAIIVPLISRNEVIGVIHFFCAHSGRKYEESQKDLALRLARRVSAALESARLYQASQEAVAACNEFISIAAHELKTPITALKLQTQLIKASLHSSNDEQLASIVAGFDRQIDRLSLLITDLFDVSSLNLNQLHLQYERFDFRELIYEILETLGPDLKTSGSTIECNAPAPIIGTWDRIRMEQVMRNLIGNAIKYGRGGPIQLSAWSVDRPQNLARIQIQDQGIGIDESKRDLIFERFRRGTCGSEVRGLGLGLYIVRQILVAHGGRVCVQSNAGQGSTFIMEVPMDAQFQS